MNWSREWKLWSRFSDQGKFRQLLLNPTKTGERVGIFSIGGPLQYQKPTIHLKLHMSDIYALHSIHVWQRYVKVLVKPPSFTSLVPKVSHGQASPFPWPLARAFGPRSWFRSDSESHRKILLNHGFSPQNIHFNRVFHLRYPYFWKHPYS